MPRGKKFILSERMLLKIVDDNPNSFGGRLVDLYRLVIPQFSEAESIDGWPRVNRETAARILHVLMKGTESAALMWLNKGFGVNDDLKKWEVSLDGVTVVLPGEAKCRQGVV